MNIETFCLKVEENLELETGVVHPDTNIKGSSIIDSMAMLQLVSFLDQEFNLHIEIDKIFELNTINDLYDIAITKEPV